MPASELDFSPAIDAVCQMLGRERSFIDEEGYDCTITAAAIDSARDRYAWVEWRSRDMGRISHDSYHLYARVDGIQTIRWEIETYNPHFGCSVQYLDWHGDHLVIIYREKHDTYACSLLAGAPITRLVIPDAWQREGETIVYPLEKAAQLERLSLPTLALIPPGDEGSGRKKPPAAQKKWYQFW